MSQSKKEILQFFEEDYTNASDKCNDDQWLLSDRDEVLIIYKSHYPDLRDDFNEIIEKNAQFFDYS